MKGEKCEVALELSVFSCLVGGITFPVFLVDLDSSIRLLIKGVFLSWSISSISSLAEAYMSKLVDTLESNRLAIEL